MLNTTFKSIFNTIEEAELIPKPFTWKLFDDQAKHILNPKFTKLLYTKRTDGSLEEAIYYLQPMMLYKIINSIHYRVSLRNTRILKVDDSAMHLFGIRIMGFKGQDEIYAINLEDRNSFFSSLKNYCTCFHLMNEFNLIKVIGRGNFSKVHLGSRLGTNQKYAIKSIDKKKILDNERGMVCY